MAACEIVRAVPFDRKPIPEWKLVPNGVRASRPRFMHFCLVR